MEFGVSKKANWNWNNWNTRSSVIHLKSRKSMKYDISKSTAPTMPILGKGTECIKILLSQASKGIQEPLVPMLFPVLGVHISGAEFQYPDNSWKEPTGMMTNLVANSGDNKGQLSPQLADSPRQHVQTPGHSTCRLQKHREALF